MYIFKTTKKLVQEKLIMLGCKIIICLNYLVKVGFHQLKNNIDIFEFPAWRRKHDMLYFNNVRMTKQPKEFNFSQNTCGIRNMLKNIVNLLDCDPFSSMRVNCRANNTITTFSNDFLYLVLTRLSILSEENWLCRALYKESNILFVSYTNCIIYVERHKVGGLECMLRV